MSVRVEPVKANKIIKGWRIVSGSGAVIMGFELKAQAQAIANFVNEEIVFATKDDKIYATPEEIGRARDYYQGEDIEIDDIAPTSEVEGEGKWVAAWVWLGASAGDEDGN